MIPTALRRTWPLRSPDKRVGRWSASELDSQQRWQNDTHAWLRKQPRAPMIHRMLSRPATSLQPNRCTTRTSTNRRLKPAYLHVLPVTVKAQQAPPMPWFLTQRCFTLRAVDKKAIMDTSYKVMSRSRSLIRKKSATSLCTTPTGPSQRKRTS